MRSQPKLRAVSLFKFILSGTIEDRGGKLKGRGRQENPCYLEPNCFGKGWMESEEGSGKAWQAEKKKRAKEDRELLPM